MQVRIRSRSDFWAGLLFLAAGLQRRGHPATSAVLLRRFHRRPDHGEPLRSQAPLPDVLRYCALALALALDDRRLSVVFRGDAAEMIAAVESLLTRDGEACPLCDRERHSDGIQWREIGL